MWSSALTAGAGNWPCCRYVHLFTEMSSCPWQRSTLGVTLSRDDEWGLNPVQDDLTGRSSLTQMVSIMLKDLFTGDASVESCLFTVRVKRSYAGKNVINSFTTKSFRERKQEGDDDWWRQTPNAAGAYHYALLLQECSKNMNINMFTCTHTHMCHSYLLCVLFYGVLSQCKDFLWSPGRTWLQYTCVCVRDVLWMGRVWPCTLKFKPFQMNEFMINWRKGVTVSSFLCCLNYSK